MHISNIIKATLIEADFSFSDLWSVSSEVDVDRLVRYIKKHDLHNRSNFEGFVSSRLRKMNKSDVEILYEILVLGEYIVEEKTDHKLDEIEIYDYQTHDWITGLLSKRFNLSQGTITSLLFERVPLPETRFIMPEWCLTVPVRYDEDHIIVPDGSEWQSYNIEISPFSNFADNYPGTFGRWISKLSKMNRAVNLPERIPA